jgi:hypothetical protein
VSEKEAIIIIKIRLRCSNVRQRHHEYAIVSAMSVINKRNALMFLCCVVLTACVLTTTQDKARANNMNIRKRTQRFDILMFRLRRSEDQG